MRRCLVRFGRVPAVMALVLISLMGCGPDGPDGPDGAADRGPTTPGEPGGQLSIVALGDSVTAGTGCDCATFVQLYASRVAARTGAEVTWTNDGVNGQTSGGLVTDLRSGTTASDVGSAAVVLVTVGANDLGSALDSWQHGGCSTSCMAAHLPAISANIARIVTRVHQLQRRPSALIAVTDYWNVFEDGQVADRDFGNGFAAWSDRLTLIANAAICSAARQASAICVDLYSPFNGAGDRDPTPLLAEDGDHPDARGHEAIADALAAAVMPVAPVPVRDR